MKHCLAASLVLTALAGCASVVSVTNQTISLQTLDAAGRELAGATCELSNNRGKWFVITPGTVKITRGNENMLVVCQKENHDPGRASVASETKGAMFGNIMLGGGIGALIDHNSGAAYEYPTFFTVQMGRLINIQADSKQDSSATATPP